MSDTVTLRQVSERHYDAFISYNYAVDGPALAPALQRGLSRLAKPWYRAHALRVFRDQTGLDANPSLRAAIYTALDSSRFFVLMASPESAKSGWVGREIEYWRKVLKREQRTFLIVLTSGTINWDEAANDFDWAVTTALSKEHLSGWFESEPLWVNLAWAREEPQLSLRHNRFQTDVAALAAPIHDVPKEELADENARQHRRFVRAGWAAATALAVLTVITMVLSLVTVRQEREAVAQRDRSMSRELAARSETIGDGDPALARLLSLAAWRISPTPEARASMLRAAARPGAEVLREVGSPVFSPDGKTLAVVGYEAVKLRHGDADWRELKVERPREVVFNHDGSALAVMRADGVVQLWRTDGKWIGAIAPHLHFVGDPDTPMNLAFHPDGSTVAVTGPFGEIQLWDITTRQLVRSWFLGFSPPMSVLNAASLIYSRDGRTLITASTDGKLRFWDSATGAVSGAPIDAHPAATDALLGPELALAQNGATLVFAGTDGTLRFWDLEHRTPIGLPLSGHTRPDLAQVPPSVAAHPDSPLIATGSQDGTVRMWHAGTRQQVGSPLAAHSLPVTGVAISPDGRTVASTSLDRTLRLWDVSSHREVSGPLSGFSGPVYALAFSEDGRSLVTGGDNGGALTTRNGHPACQNTDLQLCASNGVTSVGPTVTPALPAPSQDTSAPTFGPTVRFIDVATRRQHGAMSTGLISAVTSMAMSTDGNTFAIGGIRLDDDPEGDRGGVLLLDLRNGAELGGMTGAGEFRALAFSPDGKALVAGQNGPRGTPNLIRWDTASRSRTDAKTFDYGGVYATAFSPDGRLLTVAGAGGVLRLWDGDTRHELRVETGAISALAYSPDGRTLVTAGNDGAARLWDAATRTQLGEPLRGHTGPVFSVVFSPDGRLLATGSGDHTVRVWDLGTRRQVSPGHLAHAGPVRSVRFSPDGRTLASAGDDSAVRLWDIGYAVDVEKSLCEQAGRSLGRDEWAQYLPDASYHQVC